MILKTGIKAPPISLMNQDEKIVSLDDFKGQNVVVYFYPKDDTPGCTAEACNFRDGFAKFGKLNAVILGISPDSPESHKKFKIKYNIPFDLLSDEKKVVVKKYDVWKEKNMYGKKYMGVERTTFIIDGSGKIVKIFPKVKVENHHKEVMEALKELV